MSRPMDRIGRDRGNELRNVYRFGVFALAIGFGVVSLGARMVYLQVYQGPEAYVQPSQPDTEIQQIPSTRGLIYDASGKQLVQNVVSYEVYITLADLPVADKTLVANRLAAAFNVNPVDIESTIDSATGSMYTPVKVADNVDVSIARFLQENAEALPGVTVRSSSKREYLDPALFSQIIGYNGQITAAQYKQLQSAGYSADAVVGQAGIENSYESVLRGTPGTQIVALDENGKPIPGLISGGTAPIPGSSLTLTIDTQEQKWAETALAWGVAHSPATSGVIIVENPQNGEILAMVSLPTYNDQLFADGISETDFEKLLTDPNQPLLNKAIGAQYPEGSTYKLVTGTAGLQDQPKCKSVDDKGNVAYDYCNTGVFTANTPLRAQPQIVINGYPYTEWQGFAWFGPLTIRQGLAHSSDTFFYQLSRLVGVDRLAYWAHQYGFGQSTGIDLPGEAIGIVPDNQWKIDNVDGEGMFTGETLYAGIGQGFDAATPLQLLNAYCALANGGNVWQPHVVKAITPPGAAPIQVQPTLLNKLPASAQNLEIMRLATRDVVTSRHTYNLVDMPIKVAGKTGTAEFGVKDKNGNLPYSEWFVGYVPGDPYNGDFTKPDSQLAVLAFLYGADSLGNVATEVVKYYLMEHFKLQRYPLSQTFSYRINLWAGRRTNYYNLGQLN
jgi:penicillin-binding protein 2